MIAKVVLVLLALGLGGCATRLTHSHIAQARDECRMLGRTQSADELRDCIERRSDRAVDVRNSLVTGLMPGPLGLVGSLFTGAGLPFALKLFR